MSSRITEFRQSRWVVVIVGLGAACSVAGFVVLGKTLGSDWPIWLLGGLAVMFVLGLVDAVSSSVRLDPDVLQMRNNFRHRMLKREQLVEVSWAKGCPVSVKDRSGKWTHLPPLGDSSAMANGIRAWLKGAQQGALADTAKPGG